jgi:alpha-acetolactate decarboxylase/formylmethanofuran dehydrogenase subunit E
MDESHGVSGFILFRKGASFNTRKVNKMKYSFLFYLITAFQLSFSQVVIKNVGSMSQMGKEGFKAAVHLDSLPKNNLFGIGPFGKMEGEITIVDGKPMIAQVKADGSLLVNQTWQAGAPFFVYSNVADWVTYELNVNVENLSDLQQALQEVAIHKGYSLESPFAFRVMGEFNELTTHVVLPHSPEIHGYQSGKNQISYTYKAMHGELIGFYSQRHHGTFTPKESNIHIHFVSDDMTKMGHVDKLLITGRKLKLLLPAKTKTTGSIRINTNDTDFSKGRLGHIQEITLDDVAKFHGHLCDGLVVGFLGLREALYKLYPDSIVDRTNTRIVSNPSPCITDVGVYLTGGRYQFNTYYVDDKMKAMFTVSRIDNNQAFQIKLKPGIKPMAIDSLGALAVKGQLSACELDSLKNMEDSFSMDLFSKDPKNIFEITLLKDFKWSPQVKNDFIKTDVLNKGVGVCK